MVLEQQALKTYYRIYDLNGSMVSENQAPRTPYTAHAVEGTPILAIHYMQ